MGKRQLFPLTALEVSLLMYHVHAAACLPDEIGFEDADRTLDEMERILSKRVISLPREVIESALWSANLMDEMSLFFHPKEGVTFERFIKTMLQRAQEAGQEGNYFFDRFYNTIEFKGKGNKNGTKKATKKKQRGR